MTRRILLLAAALGAAALPSAAQAPQGQIKGQMTATVTDRTAADTAVRRLAGAALSQTITKGMTPNAWYSQVLLSRHGAYQVMNVGRDKTGQAEIHADFADHVFIQSGEGTLMTGGSVPDAKDIAPGERRGSAVIGGNAQPMKAGDYFFIPPGVPHQMILPRGGRIQYITFKTNA